MDAERCCRICCCVLGCSPSYRIFSKLGSFTQVGLNLVRLTAADFDEENFKASNPLLCQHCYKEVNALLKRDSDLRQSKEDLKAKLRKSAVFFSRRKRCRASCKFNQQGSVLSTPTTTPCKDSKTPPLKRQLHGDSPVQASPSTRNSTSIRSLAFVGPAATRDPTITSVLPSVGQMRPADSLRLAIPLPACTSQREQTEKSGQSSEQSRQVCYFILCVQYNYILYIQYIYIYIYIYLFIYKLSLTSMFGSYMHSTPCGHGIYYIYIHEWLFSIMCSMETPSLFRKCTKESLVEGLSFSNLAQELQSKAPILSQLLLALSQRTPSSLELHGTSHHVTVVVLASIILRERNMHMNAVQYILGILLWYGHASKEVSLDIIIHCI